MDINCQVHICKMNKVTEEAESFSPSLSPEVWFVFCMESINVWQAISSLTNHQDFLFLWPAFQCSIDAKALQVICEGKSLVLDERDAGSCCCSRGGKSKRVVSPFGGVATLEDRLVYERCYGKVLNFKMPLFCPVLENTNLQPLLESYILFLHVLHFKLANFSLVFEKPSW